LLEVGGEVSFRNGGPGPLSAGPALTAKETDRIEYCLRCERIVNRLGLLIDSLKEN